MLNWEIKNNMKLAEMELERDTEEQCMSQDNCIFLARTGSQMYGTNTINSDDDFTGIYIASPDYSYGLKKCELVEYRTNKVNSSKRNSAGDVDVNLYSLYKYVTLALNNNPNILELLYAPNNCILQTSKYYNMLRNNRDLFLSKKVYQSFRGYAHSQRMRTMTKSGNNTGRIDLIEKYHYDTKLMSHNIRLYLECMQLLNEGTITLPLPERKMVVQIKRGEWKLEEVLKKSDELSDSCTRLYENTRLPDTPDFEGVNKLLMNIQEEYWGIECKNGSKRKKILGIW
jgi:predicted nucleotidyltransferase